MHLSALSCHLPAGSEAARQDNLALDCVRCRLTDSLTMHIKPFRIEQYFGKYEFTAEYLLSSSDAESRTIQGLLALEPDAHERFLAHWCGYTESPGAPWLREAVGGIYTTLGPGDVLVVSSAEEGIFVLYHALAGPGDHIIVETPCYESALEVARSTGAEISEWRRRPEDGWAHDVAALEAQLRPRTKIIYINTPHNPTGLLMAAQAFRHVLNLAANKNIFVFSDEVYRELEHDPAARLPAACDVYARAVSLGSMSKTYGLPGLRLGWLATRDASTIQRCLEFRYYTTICNSAPSEFLSALALRHREKLVERNREIVLSNLPLLDTFIKERPDTFSWIKPNASTIGFVRYQREGDVHAFCEELVRRAGVLLLPGSVYDEPRFIRFGYGRRNMPQALQRLRDYLDAQI